MHNLTNGKTLKNILQKTQPCYLTYKLLKINKAKSAITFCNAAFAKFTKPLNKKKQRERR